MTPTEPAGGIRKPETTFPVRAAYVLILLGIILRLVAWLARPSFWEDEIFTVLGIAQNGFAELVHPLELQQVAPLGFLWIQRLCIQLFGVGEYSLRLFPLVTGIAALPAVWLLARRLFGVWTALFAVALVSLSPVCVRYSAEAKPYGPDLLVTVLLLYGSVVLLEGDLTWRRALYLAASGVLAICFSLPSIFILAGTGVLLTVKVWTGPRFAGFVKGGLVVAVWIGAFLLSFFTRTTPEIMAYMHRFWASSYLSAQPGPFAAAWMFLSQGLICPLFGLDSRVPLPVELLALALFVGGAGLIVTSRDSRTILLTGVPVAALLILALAGEWVCLPRLTLFMAPVIAMIAGQGAAAVAAGLTSRGWSHPVAASVLGCFLLGFSLKASIFVVRNPKQHLREGVAFAMAQARPGDLIYLYSRAVPGWAFYSTDWATPDPGRVNWFRLANRTIGPNGGNIPSRGRPVQREGWELKRPFHGGWELVGIGEGVERTGGTGEHLTSPDVGWRENEYRRVLSLSPTRVVLVGLPPGDGFDGLAKSFQSLGARKISEFKRYGATVVLLDLRQSRLP